MQPSPRAQQGQQRWDPNCPQCVPQSHQPSQLHLSSHIESSFHGQRRQGPRTKTLSSGDAPQRHVGNLQQLGYRARRSQAPAHRSSSCHVCPQLLLGKSQLASEGKTQDSKSIHLQSATPSPRHGDGSARPTWLHSSFPSLKAGRQGCKRQRRKEWHNPNLFPLAPSVHEKPWAALFIPTNIQLLERFVSRAMPGY